MVTQRNLMQARVWGYYRAKARDLPWRRTKNPYEIAVSEMMLQQTQVTRVLIRYEEFLNIFPSLKALADSPLSKVLMAWQGLGYNRRAVNLHRMAKIIQNDFGGKFPRTYDGLLELPGIGPGTAGALMNFCYGIPTPFIETNIRTVYLHHFFKDQDNISDKEILTLIEKTLDRKNPREWFYALYDYGSMLKRTIGNQNKKSKHYKKQSAFKGSNREMRSKILRAVLAHPKITEQKIFELTKIKKVLLKAILDQYIKEGALKKRGSTYTIAV